MTSVRYISSCDRISTLYLLKFVFIQLFSNFHKLNNSAVNELNIPDSRLQCIRHTYVRITNLPLTPLQLAPEQMTANIYSTNILTADDGLISRLQRCTSFKWTRLKKLARIYKHRITLRTIYITDD